MIGSDSTNLKQMVVSLTGLDRTVHSDYMKLSKWPDYWFNSIEVYAHVKQIITHKMCGTLTGGTKSSWIYISC